VPDQWRHLDEIIVNQVEVADTKIATLLRS
jgi:hypothetical protein